MPMLTFPQPVVSFSQSVMAAEQFPIPTKIGKVPFKPSPASDVTYETAYRAWGDINGSQPPLIGLHGGPGGTSASLENFCLLHSKYGIPVILYDQLGCGESTRLREKKGDTSFWTIELFIAELRNLIDTLGLTKYSLAGHSYGGMLGTQYTLTQPKGLQKLVIISSPSCTAIRVAATERQKAALPGANPAILKKHETAGTTDHPDYKAAMALWSKKHLCRLDPMPAALAKGFAAMEEDSTVYSTMYGATPLTLTGPLKDYDARPRLHEITETTAPGGVLLANGSYDPSRTEVMMPYFTLIRARVKWVEFANSSHVAHWEEEEHFFRVVSAFLLAE